ncbi:MAG: hypothetical protein C0602_10790 [Denitrovibrio sp.]|nr:MAG: hypothetical protein C0602_10790 [Denitrovibrio sp.]
MGMSFEKLENMSREDLVKLYDKTSESTVEALNFIREEINRRDVNELNNKMLGISKSMKNMTIGITFLTVVNVFVAVCMTIKG